MKTGSRIDCAARRDDGKVERKMEIMYDKKVMFYRFFHCRWKKTGERIIF